MFGIVRVLIGCLILGIGFLIIFKRKCIHKKAWTISIIGIVILLIEISAFIPIENALITFDSPQAAYQYYHLGSHVIKAVVEGDDCALVVGRKGNTDSFLIVPKHMSGWKIGLGIDARIVKHSRYDDALIIIYQYKSTNNFFVSVSNVNGKELAITDNCHSKFLITKEINQVLEETEYSYYAYIPRYDDSYTLTINDQLIALGIQ